MSIGVANLTAQDQITSPKLSIKKPLLEFYTLKDRDNKITCKSIRSTHITQNWQKSQSNILRLGFNHSSVWLRLKISDEYFNESSRFVVFSHYMLGLVERCSSFTNVEKAGLEIPFSSWPLKSRFPAFELYSKKEQSEYTYFKMKSLYILNFPIQVYTLSQYTDYLQTRQILQYSIVATLSLVGLFYLLVWLFGRETLYLYFALLVWSVTFTFFVVYGDAYIYLWPNSPKLQQSATDLSRTVSALLATLFARWLLQSWTLPRLDTWIKLMIALSIVNIVISLIPDLYIIYIAITSFSIILAIVIVTLIGIIQLRRNQSLGKFYIMGWVLFLMAIFMNMSVALGWIDYSFYMYFAPVFITPVEVMFFIAGSYQKAVLNKQEIHILQDKYNQLINKAPAASATKPNVSSQLLGIDVQAYIKKLIKLMQDDKLYEVEDLKLDSLAHYLGLRSHQLSELINKELQLSFTDFVQKFRIKAAKKMLSDSNNQSSILDIGLSVGFNSKATFNRSFVRITGMQPRQYRSSHLYLEK